MTSPKILFVSHSANRNGATILLLTFLRWLKENSDYRIEVLVNGTGELIEEFRQIAPTFVWKSPTRFIKPHRRTAWTANFDERWLQSRMAGRKYDLVYFNTAAVHAQAQVLMHLAPKRIWHIHELEYALHLQNATQWIPNHIESHTRWIVVSNAVRKAMAEKFHIPDGQLDTVHGFISRDEPLLENASARRSEIRKSLGWPEDGFVVGGCGTLDWRKGTDLFIQVAKLLVEAGRGPAARFLWVGGGESRDEVARFEHDVRTLGLTQHCKQVNSTANVSDYYHAMDVLALTSREDPFPLVMLEAGIRGLPVVCFAQSGGGSEFVGNDAGLVAPYLDVPMFAKHLQSLRTTPSVCKLLGEAAAAKVRTHFSIDTQCAKLLASIERSLHANDTDYVTRGAFAADQPTLNSMGTDTQVGRPGTEHPYV